MRARAVGEDLPPQPGGRGEGAGGPGGAGSGGPLTLAAVLFAIVRAHPAAVMPAVSRDTPSLGRTACALRPRKARAPGPSAAHSPRSGAEVLPGAAPARRWGRALRPLRAPPVASGAARRGDGGVAAALRIRVRGRRAQCRGEPAPRGRPEARRAAAAGSPSARPAPPALSAEPRGRPGLPGVAASPLRARGCPGEGAEATCCRCPEPAETRGPAVLARGPDFC